MKRIDKNHSSLQHGFTMIEMVVVLIVLGIIATFILVSSMESSNDLMAQAEIFKSHLRFAQIKAMSESENDGVPWGIHVADAGSYVLYRNNVQATLLLPGETAQTHTFPAAVTVTSAVGHTYNFDYLGRPVDTGSPPVLLSNSQIVTLSQGSETNSITITKNTGYIP